MKGKTVFFCTECGNETAKWQGRCPACGAWNTLSEEPAAGKSTGSKSSHNVTPVALSQVSFTSEERILTGIHEFDRVLGGGIVVGSLVLVGGDPGIGKSTLLLQVCRELSDKKSILYVSGEESARQIKMRADRLGNFSDGVKLLSETSLDAVEDALRQFTPDIMIIDSIQTMSRDDISSAPGSVSQVRESTNTLLHIAKDRNITVFIVGHVTKDGQVAGPRMLEHMVDTVLYFEGEQSANYRILRAVKNRFGSTDEIGVFEMKTDGLREVANPSEYMLQGRPLGEPGSVVAPAVEGSRAILVEIQALVCKSSFQIPRRTAAGADYNRMNLLMAVLEKRLGTELAWCDAYLNVAGGMRVTEPALDLCIVTAILSSFRNKALNEKTVCFGEVGLTGEIRGVNYAAQRIREAEKLGFERCIMPAVQVKELAKEHPNIELIGVSSVKDLNAIISKS
jgi:DNA repair protein RadA/Sms